MYGMTIIINDNNKCYDDGNYNNTNDEAEKGESDNEGDNDDDGNVNDEDNLEDDKMTLMMTKLKK
jgi:hypothetical protein